MVVQNANDAIDNANSYANCEPGYCLKYVRTWLEIPSLEATAFDAWKGAKHKHPNDRNPPRGAPLFWQSSASGSGAGHIALCKGDSMRTTDKPTGVVANDDGSWPRNQWGQTYLGWTEDVNGILIPYLTEPADDWRASGDVYVSKLHMGQQDSDSVSRLRYRLTNHAKMPDGKKPGYGADYGDKVRTAVAYWLNNIDGSNGAGGPTDGSEMTNPQANRLFGDNYDVIEE